MLKLFLVYVDNMKIEMICGVQYSKSVLSLHYNYHQYSRFAVSTEKFDHNYLVLVSIPTLRRPF